MGSERIGCGRHTSPAPTERNSRYANSSGGDGSRETQQVPGRHAADPRNPRVRIRSRASAHRCARGEIAQAKRIPARTEVLKRAETDAAQIPRAQDRSSVAGALSSPGKARESHPEKTAPAFRKVHTIGRSNCVPGVVRAAPGECERSEANAA